MSFTISQQPAFLQSVYNPMLIKMTKTDYVIGDLFFVEIWVQNNKDVLLITPKSIATLLRTERQNGAGDGTCTTDISGSLQTLFGGNYTVPNVLIPFQKDTTTYHAYYFKAGFIRYDSQNREIKNYQFESTVNYCLRAALPFSSNGDMVDYCYQFDGEPVKFLTNVPTMKRKPSESTLLSFFLPRKPAATNVIHRIQIFADLTFMDGTIESGSFFAEYNLSQGSAYTIDVKPQRFSYHARYAEIVKYGVYLKYFDDTIATVFTETKEFEVGEDIPAPVEMLYMNRLGGWDSIQFLRNNQTNIKTKNQRFTSGYVTRLYSVDTTTTTTFNSGWLTQPEYDWLKDMIVSPALFINREYYSQTDSSYKFNTMLGLTNLEIEVAPEYEENTIKL